jgi:predicted AlkP superfamily phosphohydrolase/phosphomutase
MGFIYLNLRGREPKGTVDPTEAPDLIAEIRDKLLAATDPENGNKICDEVYVTAEIHSGPHLDLESDLIVGFAPRYRVSWSTTSGGITMTQDDAGKTVVGPVCQDNDSPWSGDHISMAVEAVAGVLLSNRPLSGEDATPLALQIAPTALALLGVPVPAEMDAAPLRFR